VPSFIKQKGGIFFRLFCVTTPAKFTWLDMLRKHFYLLQGSGSVRIFGMGPNFRIHNYRCGSDSSFEACSFLCHLCWTCRRFCFLL
jgi:hypothetical protein